MRQIAPVVRLNLSAVTSIFLSYTKVLIGTSDGEML
jgi:hypothetical protein